MPSDYSGHPMSMPPLDDAPLNSWTNSLLASNKITNDVGLLAPWHIRPHRDTRAVGGKWWQWELWPRRIDLVTFVYPVLPKSVWYHNSNRRLSKLLLPLLHWRNATTSGVCPNFWSLTNGVCRMNMSQDSKSGLPSQWHYYRRLSAQGALCVVCRVNASRCLVGSNANSRPGRWQLFESAECDETALLFDAWE
jgi:hypothetical protein